MEFLIEHRFPIERSLYMREVYFHPELGKRIDNALGLGVKTLVEEEDTEKIFRKVNFVSPQRDLPAAVRKVFGNKGLGYYETTIFYKDQMRLEWRMKTEMMPDRIYGGGEILLLSDGEHIIRRVTGDITASIFGVGKMIEKASIENVRESYDKAAEITRTWIIEHHSK